MSFYINESLQFAGRNVVVLLIGNKSDLNKERIISWDKAKVFADRYNLIYIETSAKTGQGVEQAFIIGANAVINSFDAM